MKRLLYLLIVWLAALGSQQAMAQSENTWTKAQYDALGKIVKWTDSNGESHTNLLTDVATDPYHIYYLLREVYKNPSVPGILQGGYKSDGTTREGDVKYERTISVWNLDKTFDWKNWKYVYDVQPPTQEGYTTLLVKVKDTWSKSDAAGTRNLTQAKVINEISKGIESVQLLTDAMRFDDGSNPGTLYKLTGSGNRFFFLSKGRARTHNGNVAESDPFMGMYEEYSPVSTDASTGVTDFYSKMMNGDVFSVVHDCGSVLANDHWFSMSGSESTEQKSLDNIMFFIPDKRLTAWDNRDKQNDVSDFYYTNYNQSYAPKVSLYTVKLKADTTKVAGTNRYTVVLNWSTSLKEITGSEIDQVFKLYVVDENGQRTLLEKDPLTNQYTYSYEVDQKEHGYSITYQITAQPTVNGAGLSEVWSNYAQVAIPGLDPKELLTLGIGGSAYSKYDQDKEVNQYRNSVMMNNSVGTFIAADNMAEGSKFTFYRTSKLTGMAYTETSVAAVVTITAKTNAGFEYKVEYKNQAGADDTKYPAKTGTFGVKDNGAVDFNNFIICDQFNASTAQNAQPERYIYQVKYAPDGTKEEFYSNEFDVKVYKTSSEMPNTVTEQAAKGDIDHSLSVTAVPQIKFSVDVDNAIKQYTMMRGDANIGRAQNRPDGTYGIFELFTDGEKLTGESKDGQATVNDNTYDFTEVGKYVPVINVNVDNDNVNTYGCDIKDGYMAKVTATVAGKDISTYKFKNIDARYFKTTIALQSYVPEGLTIKAYRLWRDCGGKAVEEDPAYKWRENPLTPWFNGFDNKSRSEQQWSYDIAGGDVEGDYLKVSDTFGAKTPTMTDPLDVNYVVRLYCCDNSGHYYVAETTLTVTYDNGTPTGLTDVTGDTGNGFSVMPSIATSQITVKGCNGAIVVRSITGAEVMRINGNGETLRTVSVGNLAPGYYIVTSGGHSQRIIKN